jgi:hypothetical protein
MKIYQNFNFDGPAKKYLKKPQGFNNQNMNSMYTFDGSTTFPRPNHKLHAGRSLNFEKTVKIYIVIFALLAGFCVVFSDFSSISDISGILESVLKQISKSR